MSNPLYQMFATDKAVEKEGILINYGDVRFRIARAGGGNQKFQSVFKELSKPYRRQIDQDQLSDEVSEKIMAEVYARTVILGWDSKDGVEADGTDKWKPTIPSKDGSEQLEFNVKNVMRVLIDLPELFTDIKVMAQKASNFRKEEVAEDAGN